MRRFIGWSILITVVFLGGVCSAVSWAVYEVHGRPRDFD
jgi:hypothetical protein